MSGTNFGAELLCLPEIFEQRYFTVPDYQRAYAWDERQVDEMLKDLDHLLNDSASHRHYTGTLVLSLFETTNGVPVEYHVVDGQQRLTTLVIVLRALATHLPVESRSAFDALYLRRGALGSERFVLRLNADTRQFFERVIMGSADASHEPMPLEAHRRLLSAKQKVTAWMKSRLATGTTVEQLRATIESRLGFLVYAPKEDAETGIMFEVINNRGKQLSELEKVKNYLIYCCVKLNAPTLRQEIDESWSEILRNLNAAGKTSSSEEGAFLRYCMVVQFKANKTDSQYGYDLLKKRLVPEHSVDSAAKSQAIESMREFVGFLKVSSLWYARLFGQQHDSVEAEVRPLLEQLRAQDRHASIMPLFLALVIRNQGRGAMLRRLLSILERVNFRVYMARKITERNDSGQGDLYNYAAAYYHKELLSAVPMNERKLGKDTLTDDDQALEYRLVEFALWFATDERFLESFRLEKNSPDDFFRWTGLRYFLMSYEQYLQPNKTIPIDKIVLSRAEGKSADFLSVEHRWAVGNRSGKGENDRTVDSFEKRRLGNFTLLELRVNIQAGKASLDDKIEHYLGKDKEPGTDLQQVKIMVREAKKILKEIERRPRTKNYFLELHRTISDKQEEALCRFARKRWSLQDCIGYHVLKRQMEEE